jgi:hypothetical protein
MTTNSTFQVQKQFKCSGCGGELQLMSKRTKFVGCPYCGSVADANSLAYKVIAKMEKPSNFPAYSFIRLGMIGTFQGVKYKVIGRTRFRMDYKEYWSDDSGSGYSNEVWYYDEWQLLGENFTFFYLVEDIEGFKISEMFYPAYPNLPKGNFLKSFDSNSQKQIKEYGTVKVTYFEGEATYQVKVGNLHQFAIYGGGFQQSFVVETRLGAGNEPKEISFYKEKPFAPAKCLEAFAEDERVKDFYSVFNQKKKARKTFRIAYTLICIVFFFMAFFSLVENDVFTQDMTLSNYKETQKTDSLTEYQLLTDFFELKDVGKVYNLNVNVTMPDNMDSYTEIEVQDSKGSVVNEVVGNFYRASGDESWSEGGESGVEHWEENETSFNEVYQLDSAGKYRIRMVAQISKQYPESVQYAVRVSETTLTRYYLVGFFIALLFVIFGNRSPNLLKELRKMSGK